MSPGLSRLFATAMVLAPLLAGCAGMPVDAAPQPSFTAYPGPAWFDQDGREVPVGVVAVIQGNAHCGWESAAVLHLGWPLGTNSNTSDEARHHARDPEGVLSGRLMGDFQRAVEMPGDAELTYRTADLELYISPSDIDRYVYVAHQGTTERWPRAVEAPACA